MSNPTSLNDQHPQRHQNCRVLFCLPDAADIDNCFVIDRVLRLISQAKLLLQIEDDILLLRRRCNDDNVLCEFRSEAANLVVNSTLVVPGEPCECCLRCSMDSLLRRNSRGVAAPEERASAGLQIEEIAIKRLKSIARVAAGKAIAICQAIEALVEEGIRVFRVEGEVKEMIAIVL